MQWAVYILRCADDSLYTGITNDLARRVSEHNQSNDKAAKYTRGRRPVELVYREFHQDRSEASKREHQIKQLSRRQKISLLQQ